MKELESRLEQNSAEISHVASLKTNSSFEELDGKELAALEQLQEVKYLTTLYINVFFINYTNIFNHNYISGEGAIIAGIGSRMQQEGDVRCRGHEIAFSGRN